jgi:hypothetical protein
VVLFAKKFVSHIFSRAQPWWTALQQPISGTMS